MGEIDERESLTARSGIGGAKGAGALSHQAPSGPSQHLKDQLELKGEAHELYQDREVLRKELGAAGEELHLRDQSVQSLREQTQSLKTSCKHQAQAAESQPSTTTLTETMQVLTATHS
ncbi:hypothetical protein AAFF_G00387900 [Aldrovandia affinis]|uniref:Uncharacterized protein n=1 Tax=Aldrovandia affinis TaxID=143900 RepID=A0AAD7SF31_9TELE|nr:hypothetical protein AAFF_G00387900 [Aldrovandia affinis]